MRPWTICWGNHEMKASPSTTWHQRLLAWASWPRIFALALIVVGFNRWMLPHIAPLGLAYLPDTHLYYPPETLWQWLAAYSPAERARALWGHLTFDLAYPLLYGALLLLLLAKSWGPRFKPWLARLPLAMILCDYGENFALAALFTHWPGHNTSLAWLACGLTLAKWLLFGGIVVAITVGFSRRRTTS